eukprot:TRINITY_DN7869_c0_g1_i1.p1 TRINITY_DN7869_c0_g1~~TRINITY_DN7869_c0_g1_i1.p1  ORF type:complete len:673 (-),score=274.01 TRINITY_DN7869_c0_g1_i1:475-2493(-)
MAPLGKRKASGEEAQSNKAKKGKGGLEVVKRASGIEIVRPFCEGFGDDSEESDELPLKPKAKAAPPKAKRRQIAEDDESSDSDDDEEAAPKVAPKKAKLGSTGAKPLNGKAKAHADKDSDDSSSSEEAPQPKANAKAKGKAMAKAQALSDDSSSEETAKPKAKAKAKASQVDEDDDSSEETPPQPKAKSKAKAKAKAPPSDDSSSEEPPQPKMKAKSKAKAKATLESEGDSSSEEPAPKVVAKAKAKRPAAEEDDSSSEEEPTPKAKGAPKAKAKSKQPVESDDSDDSEAAPAPKVKAKAKAKPKAAPSDSEDSDEEEDDSATAKAKAAAAKAKSPKAKAAKKSSDSEESSEELQANSKATPAAKSKPAAVTTSAEDAPKAASQQPCMVFIGGLPSHVTTQQLKTDFAECGEILEVKHATWPEDGSSKGIAFVTFATEAALAKCLEWNGTNYEGKYIRVERKSGNSSKGKGKKASSGGGAGSVKTKPEGCLSVAVLKLSTEASEEDLEKFFAKCGKVTNVKILKHRETLESRGIAFVDFEQTVQTDNAVLLTGSSICGQAVSVEYAKPQNDKSQGSGRGNKKPENCLCVVIKNLSPDARDEDVFKFLKKECKSITGANVVFDKQDWVSKGFAFADFEDTNDTDEAVAMSGRKILGKPVQISYKMPGRGGASW